jgi:hypothetical protein
LKYIFLNFPNDLGWTKDLNQSYIVLKEICKFIVDYLGSSVLSFQNFLIHFLNFSKYLRWRNDIKQSNIRKGIEKECICYLGISNTEAHY